jgi:type II secretory pathway component PulK
LKKDTRQSGIALLLVLSSLALLSGMVVEFAYNTHVTYNLAFNQKERAQAYYLAQSGIAFSRLILAYDKEARKLADQASEKLGKKVQVPPLYEMIPINTAMLRGLAGLGGEEALPEGEEGAEAEKTVPPGTGAPTALQALNFGAAEAFLAFEGDFSSEIQEEDSKINVNAFFTLAPTAKEYDRLKAILYHLLVSEEFNGLFEDRFRGAKELAQNIADYVDRDEAITEAGEERGREGVSGGRQVSLKNGKLLTLEELIMVPGMNDAIFQKLKPYLTVNGKDEKIYLCRAAEPVAAAVILAYTDNNPKMEPLNDENIELLDKAKEAVLNSCPDSQAMANELDKVLGVETTPETDSSGSTPETAPTTVLTGETAKGKSPVGTGTASFTLTSMIKNQADIYKIVGIGIVGETEVRVKMIVDTAGGGSKNWKELYWRVE